MNKKRGKFRKIKKDLEDKIAEKELKTEIKENYYFDFEDRDWDKQGNYCNDYCCTVKDDEVVKKHVINYE